MHTPTEETIGPRDGITIEKIEQELRDLRKRTSTKTARREEVIEGFDFDFEGKTGNGQFMIKVPRGCDGVKIRRCRFRNKAINKPAIVIGGKDVVIEDCIFEKMRGGDGREAIRIGYDGRQSGVSLKCEVRHCLFRDNSGDDEIISIKSADNTIEDCFFINNDGNLSVRLGGLTTIQHNYFEGKNGVRIHGYGNHVEYNRFKDNSATAEKRSPIGLWWGNEDINGNWKWVDEHKGTQEPKGHEGENFDGYARAEGTVIKGNKFESCRNTLVEYKKKGPKEPRHTDRDI
ncbi:MAG: right-handed parallel beta-helix repeat-containing protein [Thermoproteota archaeon]|nr:right-handed parallel beta-helix repeat-containing protein [Thermoproteota archaeon]